MNQVPIMADRDNRYVEIILGPLRKSADYLPKMGRAGEVDLEGFSELYGADPLLSLDGSRLAADVRSAQGCRWYDLDLPPARHRE